MSVYNSAAGLGHPDDSDITIINPSIMDEHEDEGAHDPQSRDASLRASVSAAESANNRNDYIFVDHNPREHAEKLEEVLQYYIRDLQHESNTQLECDRLLVVRLMDLIRPAYPTDQQKMIDLDNVMKKIADLHDTRHVKMNGKVEDLRAEIGCLRNRLLVAENESTILINQNSMIQSTLARTNSAEEKGHWTEIEGDTKKLQGIIQTQQEQINELVSLISLPAREEAEPRPSAEGLDPVVIPPPSVEPITPTPTETPQEVAEDVPIPSPVPAPATTVTVPNTLFKRFREFFVLGEGESDPEPSLVNRSPGTSPSHSLGTLINDVVNKYTEPAPVDDRKEEERSVMPPAIEAPPSPMSPEETEECPLCHQQFIIRAEQDRQLFGDHVHNCLFLPAAQPAPTEYSCPKCERKFPGDDERTYHQHLSDCFNQD